MLMSIEVVYRIGHLTAVLDTEITKDSQYD
jgi:hypothetical protein